MKKFLFTLAALLMAGAVSAETYFYIPDVELTEEQLNQPVLVDVMCHIDVAFNAYGCNLVYSDNLVADPDDDGFVTDESNGLKVSYKNNKGATKTLDTEANLAGDVYAFMGFTGATYGYWNPDGNGWVQYGAVKWEPADEDLLFFQIYVKPVVDGAKANFDGTITLTSNFSSGSDARADVIPMAGQEYNSEAHVCHITFTSAEQPTQLTADIEIGEPDGLLVPITVTNVNDPDATITVTVGGEPATIDADGNITLPAWNTDYEIVVTVTAGGADYTGVVTESETVNAGPKPKQDAEKPVITHQVGDGAVTVTVTPDPNTDGTLVYDGEYSYPRGDEDYTVTVHAYTTATENYNASETAEYTFTVPKKEPTPPTSIDELINGQNVAGVRYFNMAGQEMSQANGMTIVVVTYTDGTTSTVKVMK